MAGRESAEPDRRSRPVRAAEAINEWAVEKGRFLAQA